MKYQHLIAGSICTLSVACAKPASDGGASSGNQESGRATGGEGGETSLATGAAGAPIGEQGGAGGLAAAGGGIGGQSDSGRGGSGGFDPNGSTCAHELCSEGLPLDPACDPCAADVCTADAVCCSTTWDQVCVEEAATTCGLSCGIVLPGALVITEIMNNPAVPSDADGEWFEVYNATAAPIDMAGLAIAHQVDDPSAVHVIGRALIVAPGGYVVLGANANALDNGGVELDYEYAGVSLNNTNDYLAIQTDEAVPTIIDEVLYDQASGLDPDGASRNLAVGSLDATMNDSELSWCEASTFIVGNAGDRGTPGEANDPCP